MFSILPPVPYPQHHRPPMESLRYAPVYVCGACRWEQHGDLDCARCGSLLLYPQGDAVLGIRSTPRPRSRPRGWRIAINGGVPRRKEQ